MKNPIDKKFSYRYDRPFNNLKVTKCQIYKKPRGNPSRDMYGR